MTRLRYPFAEIGLRCGLCNLTEYMDTSGGRVGARMIDWRRRHAQDCPGWPGWAARKGSPWTSTARCSTRGRSAPSFHGQPERMARRRSPICSTCRTRPSTRHLCCSARRGAPTRTALRGHGHDRPRATFCITRGPESLPSVRWHPPCSCEAPERCDRSARNGHLAPPLLFVTPGTPGRPVPERSRDAPTPTLRACTGV